jgi:hypothetical protein
VSGPTAWCLRLAGLNAVVNGFGFGAFDIPAMVHVARGEGVLYTFGNPTYGYGSFANHGIATTLPLLMAFFGACAVLVVGGILLLVPRSTGIVVTLAGMLMCATFWWGFALPFAWVNAVIVLVLLGMAWAVEQSQLA